MHIRPARPEDAPHIGTIQVEAWRQRLSQWAPADFVAQFNAHTQAEKYAQRMADPAQCVLVAEKSGHVIGFASAKPNDTEPLTYATQIGALYIHPAEEGQGAATALLTELLHELRRRQTPNALLWTFRDNLPARKVYEKCGGQLLPYTNTEGQMDLPIPHVTYGWPLS